MARTSKGDSLELGADRLFLKAGYLSRSGSGNYVDALEGTRIHQPFVYPFVRHLAGRFGCTRILDLGCGNARKLAPLHTEFDIVGVDIGENIERCREAYPFGQWIEGNLESDLRLPLDPSSLPQTGIVCADVIEHLEDPIPLLRRLRALLEAAPFAVVSTPERDLVRGPGDLGPPANPAHVREWTLDELYRLFRWAGLRVAFAGLTVNNNEQMEKKTSLFVLQRDPLSIEMTPPTSFRVLAIVTLFNEEDIAATSLRRLIRQGVDVYVVDNWSTDRSAAIARQFFGHGVIGIEQFPAGEQVGRYEWKRLLARVEQIAASVDADWVIHHDVDEVRESPSAGDSLRQGLFHAQRLGFNAVDHTMLVFQPVDDTYVSQSDFAEHFRNFDFGRRPGHFIQIKAWRAPGRSVSLVRSGGHSAEFEGRRLYPYNFMLKHYPVRSQAHGERKVFMERQPRWSPEERADGWHTQYDQFKPGDSFLVAPADLRFYDRTTFDREFLVERLSRVGIAPTPIGR